MKRKAPTALAKATMTPPTTPRGTVSNPMTRWLHSYGFWAMYLTTIAMTRAILWVTVTDAALGWTLTCVIHCILSTILLHGLTGAPIGDITIRGQYDNLTFWEQIDDEYQGTLTRKYFCSVPIILQAIAFNWVRDDWNLLPWVIIATLVCIVPKLPYMHRKHLFTECPPMSPAA